MLEAALDAAGLDRAVIGLGDADLYRQLLDASSASRARRATRSSNGWRLHDLVGLEAELSALGGHQRGAVRDLRRASPSCAAAARCWSRRARSAGRRSSGPRRGCSETFEALEERGVGGPGPDRPRPAARPRLLQRRHPRGLRPGAGPRPRRRRPLRRSARSGSASTCRPRASPSTWSASTSPRWRRSRERGGAS